MTQVTCTENVLLPDVGMIRAIIDLLANFPANGKAPMSVERAWAEHFRFIEEHVVTKACPACGHQKADHSFMKITPAGKAILAYAQGTPTRRAETETGSVAEGDGGPAPQGCAQSEAPTQSGDQ